MDYYAGAELKNEYVRFIDSIADWQYFLTLTFRPDRFSDAEIKYYYDTGRIPEKVTKQILHLDTRLQQKKNQLNSIHVIEPTKRGIPHSHAMLSFPSQLISEKDYFLTIQKEIENYWEKKNGFIHLRSIKSRAGVSAYITKYVLKTSVQSDSILKL